MATMESSTSSTEGDQKERRLSPTEKDSTPVLNETAAPLNFSELTPCQFGISVQSFTPASVSKHKDKPRLAQLKARRRSTIGVRGSPETNSLIRFMAQQKMKTPPALQTPELVRGSPFLPRVTSALRQKMATFQKLMDVGECEVCDPMPRQDSNTGGCIKTRDYLSDGNSHNGGKENHPPLMTPTPSKRRRLGPPETCKLEIRETSAPILHFSLKEQEEDQEPVTQAVTQGPQPCSETVEDTQAVLVSPPLHVDFELHACTPTKNQQDGVFELQRLSQPPPDDPATTSPAQPASSFHIPSLPSLLEMKPAGEEDSAGKSTIRKMKKSVRFGVLLSPEFFDKTLPPSTPLKKGGTPARAPTPGGSLQLRSVLKTPQRSESKAPQTQPDLSSPTVFGASPTLAMPRNRRMQSVGEDREEQDGKIVFPSMEELDSAVTSDPECPQDVQPLNLNTAFHEEPLSHILTECETKPSAASQMDAVDELASLPEQEKQLEASVEAPAQSEISGNKQPGPERESASEAPARSSRKRKQPEESEPVKRSTRSAAKSASGKMKMTSTATRRWSKDVDRSLYGSRLYASKNPTLSPITERLSLRQSLSSFLPTDPNNETPLNPEATKDSQAPGDLTVANAPENPSGDSITSPNSSKDSTTEKGRRRSGPRVRGRGLKKRKVSVTDADLLSEETLDQTGENTEGHCEDQTTRDHGTSCETPLTHTVLEQGGVDAELNSQASDGKLECHGSDEHTSDSPPSGEESSNTLSLPSQPTQRRRGRSSVKTSVLQEQGNDAEEHRTSQEVEEKEQGERAASQQENIRSSPDSQEQEGGANLGLTSWQADFNLEDVFKPVPARQQSLVRRSLRNQSSTEQSGSSGGLTWMPQTSPDSRRETLRRTRSRRFCAAPPVQPSLPEETQANAS